MFGNINMLNNCDNNCLLYDNSKIIDDNFSI